MDRFDTGRIVFQDISGDPALMKVNDRARNRARQQIVCDDHQATSVLNSNGSVIISEGFSITPEIGQDSDGNLYQLLQGTQGTQKWKPITQLTKEDLSNATE